MPFNTIQSAKEHYYIVCREQFKCETYENKVKIMSDSIKIRITIPYGVATISRLLKMMGLFCRISTLLWALLQKRPILVRSLRIEATPYAAEDCNKVHFNTIQSATEQYNIVCLEQFTCETRKMSNIFQGNFQICFNKENDIFPC